MRPQMVQTRVRHTVSFEISVVNNVTNFVSDLPKSKLDDHSCSRAWSTSETTGGADKGQAATATGHTVSFEISV